MHLAQTLASHGVPVIAASRKTLTYSDSLIENVIADYDQADHFAPLLERCSAVVYAASSSTPGSSEARPQLDGNLRPTLALIEALQLHPSCKLIYISSGGTLYGDRDGAALETDPLRPRSYHGAGKAAAEHFIHAWAIQYQGSAIILRPSNVYGPGQPYRPGFGIIPSAFHSALLDQELALWGDGEAVRDYLYIDDFVGLCRHALAVESPQSIRIYNASGSCGVSLNALVDEIDKVIGRRVRRRYEPARRVDVRTIVPDNTAARVALDWSPSTSLPHGLARAWQWFRDHE